MSDTRHYLSKDQLIDVLSLTKMATAVHVGETAVIQMANETMLRVWGKDESVIGKSLEEALPELKGQPFIALFRKVWLEGLTIAGTDTAADLEIDGEIRTFYFDFEYRAILDENGKTICILHTATDITERYLKQQALKTAQESEEAFLREKKLNEELADAYRELHEAQESLHTLNIELEQRVLSGTHEVSALNKQLTHTNSELLRMNEYLKASQDELELAINAASLATFDLDPATNRFTGNDLLKTWFGLKPDNEIPLAKATDVIVKDDRQRVIDAIRNALDPASGGTYDIIYSISNPDAPNARVVRAKGQVLFSEDDQPLRFSGVLQDITEQHRDEQRKNDFIGMVSHELKTPLTSVYGYLYLLMNNVAKTNDTFTAGLLDKVKIQLGKMTTMINGFLNVSRLESGKMHMDKELFNMADLVRDAEAESKTVISTHKLVFHPVEPTFVIADRDKIGHVISNFISNAVKYSVHGSTINIACITVGEKAVFSVKDEGIGISKNDQDNLFDRFYRVESAQTTTISGFGIGLYLCAEIIRRHSGKIWVESEPGAGSTFYFTLDVVQA